MPSSVLFILKKREELDETGKKKNNRNRSV